MAGRDVLERTSFQIVGYVRSGFREKFGIPRQPGLVTEAKGVLTLLPEFSHPDMLRGLEGFSHIWLIFHFHATATASWKPTVRPPRLGGNQRLGVFASRSMFRPNPIGLSVVRLCGIHIEDQCLKLELAELDLLDGTPVLDVKPYLPYADAISNAQSGYACTVPASAWEVRFLPEALEKCVTKTEQWNTNIQKLVEQVLAQDPRPSYRHGVQDEKVYGMRLYDFDVRWVYRGDYIEVLALESV